MSSVRWHETLGLRWPIVQAPMAGSQDERLAIEVQRAGALGSLPAAMLSVDSLERALQATRAAGVDGINVNFFCHRPALLDPVRDAAWRARLAPYYAAWGLDPNATVVGASREPFNAAMLAVLERFRPRVVSFHFGLPEPALLAPIKRWGALVLASATTPDEARWLEHHGADVIVAQGLEAGGHRGMFLSDDLATQLSTFALVPLVVDAVKRPVLAAGGIAGARGVAAAMALGANGVQVGTAFLLCAGATTSAVHRAALASSDAHVTALTNVFTGRPARGVVNRALRELGPMHDDVPRFPHAAAALAPLRAAAERAGDGGFSPLWSGQRGCPYRDGQSAGAIVRSLARGFER